ncbi:MAG: tyrosine-type recombinase/integrase [Bacteroidetes bacterium]|nr:tyrosine-type recombinase/integrase [Bacteroidota bacterium]
MLKVKKPVINKFIFDEPYNLFLKSLKNRSLETIGTYKRSLREFLVWSKSYKNFQFKVEDVEKYKLYLTSFKKLAPNSVSTYLTALRQFFNFLTHNGTIIENPALKVKAYVKSVTINKSLLSQNEIDKYVNSIIKTDERGYRDFALSKLILFAGLQEIELVRANIGDYKNVEKKTFLFVQSKGKLKKESVIEIQKDVKQAIEDYLAYRRYANDDEPLFMSAGNRTRGKRMTSRGIRERINMHLKNANLKKKQKLNITAYSLRHAAAKIYATNGMKPEELQKKFRIGKLKTALNYYN